jgi:hypothetical protein
MAETLPHHFRLDNCVSVNFDDLAASIDQDPAYAQTLLTYAELSHGEQGLSVSRYVSAQMAQYLGMYDDRSEQVANLAFHFAFETSTMAGEVEFELPMADYMNFLQNQDDPGETMAQHAADYLHSRPNLDRLILRFIDKLDPNNTSDAYVPMTIAAVTFMLAEHGMRSNYERMAIDDLERRFHAN